mgnify:CR=1 FL=1
MMRTMTRVNSPGHPLRLADSPKFLHRNFEAHRRIL